MDWREHKEQTLARAGRIVFKVGSAVLTDEHGLDLSIVESLAEQISAVQDQGKDVVLVSSGAVTAGRRVICNAKSCPELTGMPHRQAASAIGQSRLMHAYDEAFARHGKVTAQILLTRDDLRSRRRFLNARNTFSTLLSWRAVPVVNENDTVMVSELEFGDNDQLAVLLLNLAEADLFVNLTTAPGVYSANPDTNPDARRMEVVEDMDGLDLDALCGGKTAVGTGGMYSKLLAARRAAQLGTPTLIIPGRAPDCITRALAGEDLGTWVMPKEKTVSRRKFWLAYNEDPSGTVVVDQGAANALTARGKSLLPAGIVEVRGNFGRGALVRIAVADNGREHSLGAGLTNYKAADLRRIQGRKSKEIESVLGYTYHEAVHRDNMLLDAAL